MAASEMLAQAVAHHRAGRIAEAGRLYRDLLAREPANADALHLMGVAALQEGLHDDARDWIGKAIALAPERGDFHASLGNVLIARQQLHEAGACYKTALYYTYFKRMPAPVEDILAHALTPFASRTGRRDEPGLYKSQTGQDLFLDRWVFRGLENATFIDIGAHDGVTYSNSWFFEKRRHWQGVCIEPNPAVFPRLAAIRACRTLHCCVAARAGIVPFLKISGYSEMLSGMVESFDLEHRKRITDELARYGGSSETVPVAARTFDDIARECGITEAAYISIDTEGGEQSILESIDFGRVRVHALTVECNFEKFGQGLVSLMRARNFEMVKVLGADLLFLNRESPFYAGYDALRRA
jgi:FkbM family methyltransferase